MNNTSEVVLDQWAHTIHDVPNISIARCDLRKKWVGTSIDFGDNVGSTSLGLWYLRDGNRCNQCNNKKLVHGEELVERELVGTEEDLLGLVDWEKIE